MQLFFQLKSRHASNIYNMTCIVLINHVQMTKINNTMILWYLYIVVIIKAYMFVTKSCLAQNNEQRYFCVLTKSI